MIAVIDYGMGNIGSIRNMLSKIGVDVTVISDPDAIAAATRIILPGVGSFDHAMAKLRDMSLIEPLTARVIEDGVPFLGICLGMQLLTSGSDEGDLPGLGWVAGRTRRFDFQDLPTTLPVPHMGWNTVQESQSDHRLLADLPNDARFYFVHSYYVECDSPVDIVATTEYGIRFASVIGRRNIAGVQFHPEKSHRFGMKVLSSFVKA